MIRTKIPIRWADRSFKVAILSPDEQGCYKSGDALEGKSRRRRARWPDRFMRTVRFKLISATSSALALLCLMSFAARAADYVLVTDVSGSMISPVAAKGGRSRLAIIQDALRNYLAALPKDSRVKMIAFNDRFDERETILHTETERHALIQWLDGFEAEVRLNRGTRLYEAFRRGLTVAREYAKQNPNQFVEVRVLTDGEDDSRVPAERAIPEILREFPEVDARTITANLVLCGDWSSSLIVRLEQKLHPLGLDVTDASDLGQPILPPVIVQSPDPVEVGQEALFADNSPTPFSRYEWLLDGRQITGGKSLRQRFDQVASRRLTIIGIADGGRRLRAEKLVQVLPHDLGVSFAFLPAVPEPGEEVHFFGRSNGKPVRWEWSQNGRVCGQAQDVKITFPSAGTFEVGVLVADETGATARATNRVEVVAGRFGVQIRAPAHANANDEVQFASEIIGRPVSCRWEFDDGEASEDRNPVHRFALTQLHASNKVFNVRLKVAGTGARMADATHAITVVAPPQEPSPQAGFRLVGTAWKAGETIQVLDDSQGAISTQLYDFNGEGTSTNKNPTFLFTKAGPKEIRQRISGVGGQAWATNKIIIQPRYQAPVITAASATPQRGRAPLRVTLSAQVAGDYRTMRWVNGNIVVATNREAVLEFNEAQNIRLKFELLPADPSHAPVSREFSVSISKPIPVWAKVGFPCAMLAILVGVVFWRHQPRPLVGELQWECRGKSGRQKLTGRSFDLQQLEITDWKPKQNYVLRNSGYTKLIVDGTEEKSLRHKTRFSFEGADFVFLNEAL